jgi:Tfp pilus assembly protein PilZ
VVVVKKKKRLNLSVVFAQKVVCVKSAEKNIELGVKQEMNGILTLNNMNKKIKYIIKVAWISPEGKNVEIESRACSDKELKEVVQSICKSNSTIYNKK